MDSRPRPGRWATVAVMLLVGAGCGVPGVGVGTTTVPASTGPSTSVAVTTTIEPACVPTEPTPGVRSQVARRLPTEDGVVAITIDAGSDVGFTDSIIDTLADRGVQASFGITGDFARAYPTRVERMEREGHVVMNHSDAHRSFTGVSSTKVLLTTAERQADLCAADATLAQLTGHSPMPYWRPPYGDHDVGVLDDVGALGYRWTVMWTFDSLGWKGLSADAIVSRVLSMAEPGAIILMHAGSQSQDGPALGRVIDGLRAQGYTFTTVENGLTG